VGGRGGALSPPNGGAESGSKAPWGCYYAQLARSVRSLASLSSSACGIAAVTGLDASLRREVQACGRGYANSHQRCCRLSLVTLRASHRQHPAYARANTSQGPNQPPPLEDLNLSQYMHLLKYACAEASSSLQPASTNRCHAVTLSCLLHAACNLKRGPAFLLAVSHSPLMSSKAVAVPRVSASSLLANVSCLGYYRLTTRARMNRVVKASNPTNLIPGCF
jgi:hypothetical protein